MTNNMNYKKMTLDGKAVLVIKNDNGINHTGEKVTLKEVEYIIGDVLPTNFSSSTVWALIK